MTVTETSIGNVLTRTGGYLRTIASHSLQPYRGCTLGRSLCGVGCYVRHNGNVLRGRTWGRFLEVRTNAADSYRRHVDRERRWARREPKQVPGESDSVPSARPRRFAIFCSSSTEPFPPQEERYGITRSVLEAMCASPPDELILQTHSHRVAGHRRLLADLAAHCDLRVHVSIETDREGGRNNVLPGLPGHASSVHARLEACRQLRAEGLRTVVTVAPLLPIDDPVAFFDRIAEVADAVVLDHFVGGDGSADGGRTLRTPLPQAMSEVDPESVEVDYLARMVEFASSAMPGRVGVHVDGFAGRYLSR